MKILIIGLNWLGDVIMSFPAISSAAVSAGSKIDVLTRPQIAEIYAFHPGIGRIYKTDTRQALWRIFRDLIAVRKACYDRIIVFPKSFRSAIDAFICGSKSRTGYRNQFRDFLLHDAVKLPDDFAELHESRLYVDLIGYSGLHAFESPLPTINIPNETLRNTLVKYDLANRGDIAVIAPGGLYGSAKRWPIEYFAQLAKDIYSTMGYHVVLTGSKSDEPSCQTIREKVGCRVTDLSGKTGISELIHLLKVSRIVFANDSGAMHLAALTKTPLVVAVGPTDPVRTGPLTSRAAIVKGDSCPLKPCRKAVCPMSDHRCMKSITPQMMLTAALSLLASHSISA